MGTKGKKAERLLYVLAVALTPSIPLYFIYGRNALQGLNFNHFLIFSLLLAAVSLVIYFSVSKFYLRRRRTMLTLVAFWLLFWTFPPMHNGLKILFTPFPGKAIFAIALMILVLIIAFTLRRVPVNRLLANATAVVLCLLFIFNFIPELLTVREREIQRSINEQTGSLPYEIKSEFNIDSKLPSPNIYWLQMDGMMGFSGVEHFFGDPQTELKQNLELRGFIINESAQLNTGFTKIAVLALLSPTLYDSFIGNELSSVSHLTSSSRHAPINISLSEKGVSLNDFYLHIELLKALSDAGYLTASTLEDIFTTSEDVDIGMQDESIIIANTMFRENYALISSISNFVDIIVDTCALSVFARQLSIMADDWGTERIRQIQEKHPIPDYSDIVDRYTTGTSDSDNHMARMVRQLKHASTFHKPFFLYHINMTTHSVYVGDSVIGSTDYGTTIGTTFIHDENGNVYNERLEDPYDINLYIQTHRYAEKEMMAQVDTIIENDPEAIIILQGDHGIHAFRRYGKEPFDSELLFERGYSLEDQIFMNSSVISAVRVPPQAGSLTQPLDPLDISRWLVNNFVGGGNYEYLHYEDGVS